MWLSADKLSPYHYWQFWRNTEDADVGRFMRLFTDLPLDEIARLEALGGAEINEAKIILATEATALAHGRAAAEEAAATARRGVRGGERDARPRPEQPADGDVAAASWQQASRRSRCWCRLGWPRPAARRGG